MSLNGGPQRTLISWGLGPRSSVLDSREDDTALALVPAPVRLRVLARGRYSGRVANSSHTFIKPLFDRVQISTISRRLVNNDINNIQQRLVRFYPTAVTGGFCSLFRRSNVTEYICSPCQRSSLRNQLVGAMSINNRAATERIDNDIHRRKWEHGRWDTPRVGEKYHKERV